MGKIVNISKIFVKSNLKRFIPTICTMCTFLLILNILLGFILSTTGVLSDSLTNNSTMHFMEVIFEEAPLLDIDDCYKKISSIEDVESVIADFAHPILLESEDGQSFEIVNIIGMPKQALKYFGIEEKSERYFYLPDSKKAGLGDCNKVLFEEGEYYIDDNGEHSSRIVTYTVNITDYYPQLMFDMLPPDLAIIDEDRMFEIVGKMSETGDYSIHRILITVDDISNMKIVEGKIGELYPNAMVKYSLKYSNELPSYTVVLLAGSGIIVVVLLLICVFNIKNSVNQIVDQRNRDIALLSLFGSGDKTIRQMFIYEFIVYGLVTFVCSTFVSFGVFITFKYVLGIDMITKAYWVYIVFDFAISLIVFGILSITLISSRLKKLNNAKMFKEFLK